MLTLRHPTAARCSRGAAGRWLAVLGILCTTSLASGAVATTAETVADTSELSSHPVPWPAVLPFIALLLCIAICPLVRGINLWWEHNRNRFIVCCVLAAITLACFALTRGVGAIGPVLEHALIDEYVPFMMLMLSLYVISGGIVIEGRFTARPVTNTAILALGAGIASFIGTTAASMLLIRPLLRANRDRRYVTHTVIFFIFLVSNIGGCLLPIGDPPLFLGYLRGVPFGWTLSLWPAWLTASLILLAVYYVWDRAAWLKERRRSTDRTETSLPPLDENQSPGLLRLNGVINLVLLAGVVLSVAFIKPGEPLPGTSFVAFSYLRELVMAALIGLSLLLTPAGVRERNHFNYAAFLEVAVLFFGIFITMQAPLELLGLAGGDILGWLQQPSDYFWVTGVLSSVLDNAPTYVVFFESATAVSGQPGDAIIELARGQTIREDLLRAISLGAVFMGANTYIGNGPNFMVKTIAEQAGVRMPGFFGYMLFSGIILLPVYYLVTRLYL